MNITGYIAKLLVVSCLGGVITFYIVSFQIQLFWRYSKLGPSKRLLLGIWTTYIFNFCLTTAIHSQLQVFSAERFSPHLDLNRLFWLKHLPV